MDPTDKTKSSQRCSPDPFDAYGDGISYTTSSSKDKEYFRETFRINSMNMKDGETGELLWQEDYSEKNFWEDEMAAILPKVILTKSVISRETSFTSGQQLSNLRLVQHILLNDLLIEEWKFNLGFLIEGSTNTWQQTIKSAPNVMSAETLTGNVVIETSFFEGGDLFGKSKMRIYYK